MGLSSSKENTEITKVNFPLYDIKWFTHQHILLVGGGGSSKTGISNGIVICEVVHNKGGTTFEEIIRHDTGPNVVMNCAAFSDSNRSHVIVGQEGHAQLYSVRPVVSCDEEEVETLANNAKENGKLRQRKNSNKDKPSVDKKEIKNKTDTNENKKLTFNFIAGDIVKTDFSIEDPVQRVVRVNRDGKFVATGGTDGKVRIWKFPSMSLHKTLDGHTKDIDDVDFCPFENKIVTAAKDGLAIVWDYVTGKKLKSLTWLQPEDPKYLYKRCRFGKVEQEKQSVLFMIANPLNRGSKLKGFLQMWSPSEGRIQKSISIEESLSALSVRDDGRFVAIGTMFTGSVSIYIAFSLQKVLHIPGAHSMFVTGLEFLPVLNNVSVSTVAEASVISISVDNRVKIHHLPYRKTIPVWLAIIIIVATLLFSFLLCSYLNI